MSTNITRNPRTMAKRGDQIVYPETLVDYSAPGTQTETVDLADATVRFIMEYEDGTLAVNSEADIVDAERGMVEYLFEDGELGEAGTHRAEWRVLRGGVVDFRWPANGYVSIKLNEPIDASRDPATISPDQDIDVGHVAADSVTAVGTVSAGHLDAPTGEFTQSVTSPDISGGVVRSAADPYDVTHDDFGAVGDGVTDDTQAIQDALNAAAADGGGLVYLPAGVYLVTATLIVPGGVTLAGDGFGTTTIEGDTYGFVILDLGANVDITVRDLEVTQETADYNATGSSPLVNADNGSSHIRFERVRLRDSARQGLSMYGADHVTVSGCWIERTGRDGIIIPGPSEQLRVINCTFDETGDDAIAFNGTSTNCVAAGNTIYGGGALLHGGGIKVHGKQVLVANNTLVECNGYGIRFKETGDGTDTPEDGLITGCLVDRLQSTPENAPLAGIMLTEINNTEIQISDCVVKAWEDNGANHRTLHVTGTDSRLSIDGLRSVQNDSLTGTDHIRMANGNVQRTTISDAQFYSGNRVWSDASTAPSGVAKFENCHFESGAATNFWYNGGGASPYNVIRFDGCEATGGNNWSAYNDVAHDEVIYLDLDYPSTTARQAGTLNLGTVRVRELPAPQ